MNLRFVVKNDEGAVQFLLFTGLDHSSIRHSNGYRDRGFSTVMAADLGYHSPTPTSEDEKAPSFESCEFLNGGPCYYGGSSFNAEDAFDVFTDEGEEALWVFLERYHAATFKGADPPPELGRRWKARLVATL